MPALGFLLIGLGCPIACGAMALVMWRGMRSGPARDPESERDRDDG